MVVKKKDKKQMNKNKLAMSFYGSIVLTILLHYFFGGSFGLGPNEQVILSFFIFNIIFGIINIFLKVDFGGNN